MQHLIYLHGFLSSPLSEKAQQTISFARRHYPAINLHIPQLSGDISKSLATVEALIASLPPSPLRFMGSSLGGFLSTHFVEKYGNKYGAKAVLINPAVTPYELLHDYLGAHINPYSKEYFNITLDSIEKLYKLDVIKLQQPERYKVMLQTADETLDYRLAEAKYQGSDMLIEQGGNHSFTGFSKHLPAIFNFLR